MRWVFRILGAPCSAAGRESESLQRRAGLRRLCSLAPGFSGKFSCSRDAEHLRHLIRHRLRWVGGPFLTLFQVSATSEYHVAKNTLRAPATRLRTLKRWSGTESMESQEDIRGFRNSKLEASNAPQFAANEILVGSAKTGSVLLDTRRAQSSAVGDDSSGTYRSRARSVLCEEDDSR